MTLLLLLLCSFSVSSYAANTSVFASVTTVTAANICTGTAEPVPIFAFGNTEAGTNETASQFVFTTTGTYTTADISSFALYRYTANTWPGTATATLVGSVTATAAGAQTISASYTTTTGTTYFFIVANTTAGAISGHTVAVSSFTHATTVPFTWATAPTCSGTPTSAGTFTFAATPSAIAAATNFSVCATSTITLTDATVGGTWTSGSTAVASLASNASGVVTGVSGGSALITYAVGSCSITATVTVGAKATALTPTPASVCQGSTVSLSVTPTSATGGTWSSGTPATASVNTSGIVTGVAGSTTAVTISYTTPGCTAVTAAVTVGKIATGLTGATSVCMGSTTTLSVSPTTTTGGTWSSSGTSTASVSTAGVVNGVAAGGPVTISYTTPGCTAVTSAMTVNTTPSAITGTELICSSGTSTLTSTPTGGTWTSSAPSVASIDPAAGIVTYIGNGTSTITYTLSDACYKTATFTDAQNLTPISGATSFCAPITTTLISQNFNSGLTGQVGGTWTVVNVGSSTYNWAITASGGYGDEGYTGDGTPFINADPDEVSSAVINTQFISPSFSTVGAGSAKVAFNYYYNYYSTDEIAEIDYSTNGSTWTTLYNYYSTAVASGATTWTAGTPNQTISLPAGALGQATVYLRWNYESNFGNNWVVDNIVVTSTTSSATTLTDGVAGGTWSSSATGIATVSTAGVLQGITAGTTVISYTNACGTVTQSENSLGVPAAISGGTTPIAIGSSTTLTDATANGTWTSGSTSVATMASSSGVVTGVGAGTSAITYSTGCGTATTATVTVRPQTLTLSPASLNLGPTSVGVTAAVQSFTLSGTYLTGYPGNITLNSTNPEYQISSSSSGPWSSGYTVPFTSATLAATAVYVQFTPTVSGVAPGSITFSGAGTTAPPSETLTGAGANSCTLTPTAPTAMTFSGTSNAGTSVSFTPSGTPDGYLLVQGTSAFSGSPVNGTTYSIGSSLGGGTVVASAYTTAPTFPVTGLTGNTTYYYTVIPFYGGSGGSCLGGPLYPTGTQLSSSVITCPAAPISLTASTLTPVGATLSWASAAGGGVSPVTYSIAVSTNSSFTAPITGSPFTVADPTVSVTVPGVASTAYYYKVTATGSCTGPASAIGSYTTPSVYYQTVGIASGYNADVVCENSANPEAVAQQSLAAAAFDGSNYSFVSSTYSYSTYTASTGSFPTTISGTDTFGVFSSLITTGLTWKTADYNANNALRMLGSSSGSGTLVFTTPVYASNVYLLGTATNGGTTINSIILNYNDGTSSTSYAAWSLADWFSVTTPAVAGVGRINVTNGQPSGTAGSTPALAQDILANTYTASPIKSISFTTNSGSYVGILGVSIYGGLLSASTPSLASFGSTSIGCTSSTESFSISGAQLYPASGNITATAPTGFQISNNGTTWGTTATFAYTGNALAITTVYVRFSPIATGAASGNITFTGGGANNVPSVGVSATGLGGVTVSPSTTAAFGPVTEFTSSSSITYTVTGVSLTSGTVTVTSSNPDFQVSPDGSTWAPSYSFANGTSFTATLYVQYTPTVVGAETSSISITGTTISCSPPNINCTGNGSSPCAAPSVPTGLAFSATNATSTSISFTPSGTPDGYLLLRGTSVFTGTPTAGTTYSVGATIGNATVVASAYTASPTYAVSGLTANTAYYYTIIPFNGGGGGTCSGGPLYPAGSQLSAAVITCPGVPTALSSPSVTGTSAVVSWTAPAGGSASTLNYSIDVSTSATFGTVITGSPFSAGTATSTTITGLPLGITVYYRVTATGACTGSVSAVASVSIPTYYTQVPITSGLNYDIICEGTNSWSTTESFGASGIDANADAFVADGYVFSGSTVSGSAGFSTTNIENSAATSGLSWKIAPYTGNNAAQLLPTGSSVPTGITASPTGVFSFSPVYATTWYLLGASENGPNSINISVNYTDGTSSVCPTWSVADWGATAGTIAVSGLDRVSSGTASGTFYLYQDAITNPNPNKLAASISFTNTATGSNKNVSLFAVSMQSSYVGASTSSLSFGNASICTGSSAQTFLLNAAQLYPATGSVTATAPAGFQVSLNGSTWGSSVSPPYSGNTLGNTTIYVEATPSVVGTESGNITFSGGGINSIYSPSIAVTATGIAQLAVAPSYTTTAAFGPISEYATSSAITYTLSGTGLTSGTLTVTSSNGDFQVSPDGSTWSTSYSIAYGSSLNATLYMQYTPTVVGSETSSISISGTSISCPPPNINCTGSGANACAVPVIPVALTISGVAASVATASITPTGTADAYLYILSTAPFTGSPVAGTTYSVGATLGNGTVIASTSALTYNLTGLTSNALYYLTTIPVNGGVSGSCAGGPLYPSGTPVSNSFTTCPSVPVLASVTNTYTSLTFNLTPAGGSALPITYSIGVYANSSYTSPISGSPFTTSSSSYTVSGLAAGITYYYQVQAITAQCSSGYTSGNQSTGTFCTPTISYACQYYATSQSLAGLTQGVGCGASSYLTDTFRVTAGVTYTMTTLLNSTYMGTSAWIDYGNDGFNGAGDDVADNVFNVPYSTSATSFAEPVTVPTTVVTGTYRMRIVDAFETNCYSSALSNGNGYGPCGTQTYLYGSYQDFSIYIFNPQLKTSASSVSFGSVSSCSNSSAQTFSVSGTGLVPGVGSVSVTATSGFQVSLNGSTWASSLTVPYTGGSVTATPVYVMATPTVVGAFTGSVTCTGGSALTPPTVTLSGTGTGVSINPATAANFGVIGVGTTSPALTYTITGSNLTAGTTYVTTSNPDFQISPDGSTYSASGYNFANGTTISGSSIYIAYSPSAAVSETATITVTSPSGCPETFVATGSGSNNICSSPSGTPSGMTFSGTNSSSTSVNFTTSGTPDGYLLITSALPLTSGPVNTTNYSVGSSVGGGIVAGVYSTVPAYAVTGLTGNTQYYFTVYPFNGGVGGSCANGPLYGSSASNYVNTCPATPGSLVASAITSNGFNISWSSSLGGAAASSLSYTIDVSTNNTFTAPITGSPFTVTDPTTSITISGLSANTTYFYRVTAIGAGTCNSASTATGTVTTPQFTYNAITITSGLTEDVIANSSLNPANGTLGVAGTSTGTYAGFDGAGYVFVSSDYSYNGNVPIAGQSLPVSGTLTSSVTAGLPYQLGGYNSYNALVLVGATNGSTGTMTVTPQYANNLYVIASTGSGGTYGSFVNFTLNYQDGTSQAISTIYQFSDWYGTYTAVAGTTAAVSDLKALGRVSETSGGVSATSTTGPEFFQAVLTPTYTASPLVSVKATIKYSGTYAGAGYLGLFAISARTGVLYPSATSETFGSVNVCSSSAAQNFTINGNSLLSGAAEGTVVATAPAGFQVSANGTTWSSTASYVASGASGTISGSNVYVRFVPSVSGSYSGTITFSGAGINNGPGVAVSGTGVAGFITGTTTVCQNATTTLANIITVGTWSSSSNAVASVNTGGVVTGVSAGTATISYTYGCVSTVNTVTVTVNPVPSTTGPAYGPVCTGGTLAFVANATGATGYSWSGPAALTSNTIANPTSASPVDPTADGVYTVSLSNSYNCITTAVTPSVVVNAQPSATVTPSSLNLCTGAVETLTAAITGGAGAASYTWSGPGIASTTTTSAGTYSLAPSASSGNYSLAVSYSVSTGCASASAATASVIVTAPPVIASLTSSASSLCSGTSVTLTASESGGSGNPVYTWRGPGISTTTSSATPLVVTPTVSASASSSYSVSVSFSGTGCGTSSVVTSSVVTVNVQPSVILSASPLLLCAGTNMTLTTVSSGGSGTPVYTWSGPGITTVTGSSAGAAVYTPATSTGMYTVSVAYSGSGCNVVAGTSSVVTVNDQPVVSVSASAPGIICSGLSESLMATVTDGGAGTASYTWSGPGISGSAGPYTSATYTVTPAGGTPAGAYTVAVSYSVSTGCATATNSTGIIIPTAQQWTGVTSTNWSDATNWACGSVPTAAEDVVLPGSSSYTFAPTLDVAGVVHTLTVVATDTLTLGSGNTLSVVGNLANHSTITGTGVVALNGTSAQVLSGVGTVSNLTNNNTSGVSINSSTDTVGVSGTLLLNAGTFTTNGSLMLVSNASGNGSIGTIASGAHLSGSVVVQQYVPGGRRAFRFIAHPFTSSIALSQIEPYVDITGVGGVTNGFTTTTSNAPSAFWYNPLVGNSALGSDPGWTAYTSTNGSTPNAFNQFEGIRLYFRGAKGTGLTGSTYLPQAATYRTYGTVNTGAVSISLQKGTGANEDYDLIGNPYPAVTDIGTVLNNAGSLIVGSYFYVWNPYLATTGQFEAESIGTPYYLAANESFEVRTATNGNTLSFAETNKGTSPTDILMRGAEDNLALNIYDNNNLLWDKLIIKFNDAATDNEEHFDGAKPPSPASLNFYSWSADNVKLAADVRPFTSGKVIQLGITSSYAQEFIIRADNVSIPNNGQVYLHDKYLQTYTLLQQGTEYKFSITKDPATQGDKRFELGLNPANVAQASGLDVQMVPNPANSIVTISYATPSEQQTSIRVMNVEGVTVLTQDLGQQQNGSTQISLDKFASGVYMVEFTSGTNKVVHRLVKE